MKGLRLALLAFSLMLAASLGTTTSGDESTAEKSLTAAHTAMIRWLGDSAPASGWKTYLMNDALSEQLKLGEKADEKVVKQILAKYASGDSGLSHQRFLAVRKALASWLEELMIPTVEELPQAARDAKADFVAVSEQSLQQAKTATRRAANALDKYLGRGASGKGWRNYAKLDALQTQLKDEAKPDISVIADVADLLSRDYRGLEGARFVAVRDALTDFLPMLRIAEDADAESNYQKHLDSLADSLEKYRANGNRADLRKAALSLDWLAKRGQAKHLLQVARQGYWKPNLLIEVSAELITYGFNEKVDETSPINRRTNSARITGTGRTIGEVVGVLKPYGHVAVIHAVFNGKIYSRTTAVASRATIYTRGVTEFRAIKQISLSRLGFRLYPTSAFAKTKTVTTGIDSAYQSQARQRVNSGRRGNERKASREAEKQLRKRLDDQIDKQIKDVNADYYNRFVKPLSKYGAFPRVLRFMTTEKALRVSSVQAMGSQLAATGEPPPAPENRAMTMRIHESWLNNTLSTVYSGRTVKEKDFREEITNILGSTPQGLQKRADQKEPEWTITFAEQSPLSVQFGANTVLIAMRATQYKNGNSPPQKTSMNITALYKVTAGSGGPKLTREGIFQVLPPMLIAKLDKDHDGWLNADEQKGLKQGVLTPAQTALRRQLLDTFVSVFDEEVTFEPRALTGRWESLGELKADYLQAASGWLTAGYKIAKPSAK